jgi:hypothetical protein
MHCVETTIVIPKMNHLNLHSPSKEKKKEEPYKPWTLASKHKILLHFTKVT